LYLGCLDLLYVVCVGVLLFFRFCGLCVVWMGELFCFGFFPLCWTRPVGRARFILFMFLSRDCVSAL
jgi:hypothetical protein